MEERNGLSAVPEQAPSSGFSVRRLKEERHYDLTEAGVDAKGHIPFPSHERREKYLVMLDNTMKSMREKAKAPLNASGSGDGDKGAGEGGLEDLLMNKEDLFSDAFGTDRETYDALLEATAYLCDGSPSKADLKKLPPDVFLEGEPNFFGFVLELHAPKTSGASGTG